jgi:hypothetical protein
MYIHVPQGVLAKRIQHTGSIFFDKALGPPLPPLNKEIQPQYGYNKLNKLYFTSGHESHLLYMAFLTAETTIHMTNVIAKPFYIHY